ncbi:hypothetical protein MMC18_003569 [Xylographa bjoerkii]|nr:hypothetical protein [Xylographa bjoerkii]
MAAFHGSRFGTFTYNRHTRPLATQTESTNSSSEPENDPETEAAIEKEYEDTMDLKLCLDVHRMHWNHHNEMPYHLQTLRTLVLEPRQAPPSPVSRKIASAHDHTRNLSENDAMSLLEDFLGYTPQDSLRGDGERGVIRSHSQQWNANAVPIPATAQDETLAAAIKAVGSPSKPKPDIIYGYPHDVFIPSEMSRARSCSSATKLTNKEKEPLWPFLVMEWKSDLGLMDNGRVQAMRDGAAAVNTLWHLFNETGTAQPQEHETAVFCACIGPETIEIYISWRLDHPIEGLSWEMDQIYGALLNNKDMVFHARSVLLNILEWARTTRLDRVKAALKPLKRTVDSVEHKQDAKAQKPAKRSKANVKRAVAGSATRRKLQGKGMIGSWPYWAGGGGGIGQWRYRA